MQIVKRYNLKIKKDGKPNSIKTYQYICTKVKITKVPKTLVQVTNHQNK